MSSPTPIQSLIGGMGIPLAAHELLVLNGNIFGISGFLHSAVRGSVEGLAGAAGLVLGGMIVANLEGAGPATTPLSASQMALSGLLVGLGTKVRIYAPVRDVLPQTEILTSMELTVGKWLHIWVRVCGCVKP